MNSDYDLCKKGNYSEPHSQNRYFVAFLLLMWLFSPYKTAYLPECKHSQNAVCMALNSYA